MTNPLTYQLYLPHPDLGPAYADCLDGPLAGQCYPADFTREIVYLGPGHTYRLIQDLDCGEFYYEHVELVPQMVWKVLTQGVR